MDITVSDAIKEIDMSFLFIIIIIIQKMKLLGCCLYWYFELGISVEFINIIFLNTENKNKDVVYIEIFNFSYYVCLNLLHNLILF